MPFTATYSGYRPNSNFPPQKTRHSVKNIKYFTLFLKHPAKKMVFLLGHSKHSHGCGEWGRGLEAEQKKGWIVEHIHHVWSPQRWSDTSTDEEMIKYSSYALGGGDVVETSVIRLLPRLAFHAKRDAQFNEGIQFPKNMKKGRNLS